MCCALPGEWSRTFRTSVTWLSFNIFKSGLSNKVNKVQPGLFSQWTQSFLKIINLSGFKDVFWVTILVCCSPGEATFHVEKPHRGQIKFYLDVVGLYELSPVQILVL